MKSNSVLLSFLTLPLALLLLSSCNEPVSKIEKLPSRCFTAKVQKKFGGEITTVIENKYEGHRFSRCRALFDHFSHSDPRKGQRFFYVIEYYINDAFMNRIKEYCHEEKEFSDEFRKYFSSLINECGGNLFRNEIVKMYPKLYFAAYIPSVYDVRDISLDYTANGFDEDSYLSAGIIEEYSENILPICVYQKDFFFDEESVFINNPDRHADFLEGCLFQYVDR